MLGVEPRLQPSAGLFSLFTGNKMSKIYFWTPSELDLNCVRLMGVSSKQCDSPIGRFGTGLKFAIANILRTGGGFTITINNAPYHFTTQEQAIRGVDSVDVVVMNGEALGFTTSLGKHWEGWRGLDCKEK